MNTSYRTLWNAATQAWVAVSETTRARGKRSGACVRAGGATAALLVAGLFGVGAPAWASCTTASNVITCDGPDNPGPVAAGGMVLNNSGTLGTAGVGTTVLAGGGDATINNSGTVQGASAIDLRAGGTVNNLGGTIAGDDGAISISGSSGVLNNTSAGTVRATGSAVAFARGGTILNTGGGTIVSTNSTAIESASALDVTNAAGSTISGLSGILAYGNARVRNAGQINGTVELFGSVNNVTLVSGGQIDGVLRVGNSAGSSLTLDGTGSQRYSTAVTGGIIFGAALIKEGSGTWVLDRSLTPSHTSINGGTLALGAGGSLGANAAVDLTAAGVVLDISAGGAQAVGDLAGVAGSSVKLGGNALSFGAAADTLLASNITGTATSSLVKKGAGTTTLSGNNAAFGGATRVNAGTLRVGAAGALPTGTDVSIAVNATLDLNDFNQTIGSLAGAGNVSLGSGTLTTGSSKATTTFSGTLSGTGGLALTGGTLQLSGNNTFEGGLSVYRATLRASSDASLGAANGQFSLDDGTLQASGAFTSNREVRIINNAKIDTNGFDVRLTGALRDTGVYGAFIKEGAGTLTLENPGTDHSGDTFVNAGTLALKGAGNIAASALNVASGATFDISQTDSGAQANFIGGAGTIAVGGMTLTTSNGSHTTQFDGVIQDGGIAGGTGGVVHIIDAGSWTLTKAQTYTGGTTLDKGNLYLTGTGALAAGSALTMGNAALFDVSKTSAAALTLGDLAGDGTVALGNKVITLGTANSTQFAGVIAGSGASLVKQGSGTLALDGINTYSGLTSVSAGALVIGSSAAHADARVAGAVDVASGATLGGHGSIGGNVALASGAHLAPGNSIGTLTIDGNLSLAQGSVLDFEFGAPGRSYSMPGVGDSVAVGGKLMLDGATLNITDTGAMGLGLYNLFSYGDTLTQSNGGIVLGSVPADSFYIQYLTGDKKVNLVNIDPSRVLNFWNGNGLAGAVQMGGGDGTWSATQPDWTDAKGTVTAAMQPQPGFAIFGGAAGKVVVDNANGAVAATGIQFASDGYRLSGDTLTLVADKSSPGPVELRVGDGSAAGSGWNATIDNVIAGVDGIVKTGNGTLALSGSNTYTGGTSVRGGALQISEDGNLGAANGSLTLDGGTLRIASGSAPITSSRTVTLGAAGGTLDLGSNLLGFASGIGGTGDLTVTGAGGTLAMATASTYAGRTTLLGGATVSIAGAGSLGVGTVQQQGNGTKLVFTAGATAGSNSYTVGRAGLADSGNQLSFTQDASAASSKLVVNDTGWQAPSANSLQFGGTSTAAMSTITNQGGAVYFQQDATAGRATILNGDKGLLSFLGASSAGTAQITNRSGGTVYFGGAASGAQARIANAAGGTVDVSGAAFPAGVAIGSLSGAGALVLGASKLTLGALGTSDTLSGVVSDRGSAFAQPGVGTGGAIVKVGGGTLTLSGANTYTGGTVLHQGRLNVGNSQALGTGALAMDDDTTLGFSANGVTLANEIRLTGQNDPVVDTGAFDGALAGAISGGGFITKQGTGTLTLSGANTYTGATDVAQGSLRAGAIHTFSAASAHSVAAGATLDLAGFDQTVASLANSGTVSLTGTAAGTVLTVNGNYVGNNGVLKLGTALNGTGPSDRLVINAGAASGKTSVQIANLGGLGALTTGNGIEVISAQNGATTTAQTTKDAFSLAGGHIDAGAYEYRLNAGDAAGAGENWYLRSSLTATTPPTTPAAPVTTYRAEASLYAALPNQLRQGSLAMLGDLRKRVGDDDVKGATPLSTGADRRAWARLISAGIDIRQAGTVSPTSKDRLTGFQAGTDLLATPTWHAGIYVGQLDGDARVNGFASGIDRRDVGRNDLRSQYLGLYGTYTGDLGFYADAVLQPGRHRYTAAPTPGAGVAGTGDSLLASIEVGRSFPLGGSGWRIEPQLQLIHQHMSLDSKAIAGAVVHPEADNGWTARAGVRVKGEIDTGLGMLQPYGRFNLYRTSSGNDVARFVSGAGATDISAPTGGTSTELAGGFTLTLNSRTGLYGELGQLWASGGKARVKGGINGSLGVRVKW